MIAQGQLYRSGGRWWVNVDIQPSLPDFRVDEAKAHYEGRKVTVRFSFDDQFAEIIPDGVVPKEAS